MKQEELRARFNPAVAEALASYTASSPFAGGCLGLEVVSASPGRFACRMQVKEQHHSGVGAVHGGVIAALVDHSLSLAAYPLVEVGKWVATTELKVSYLAAVQGGELLAEAQVVSLGRRLGTVRVDVKNGDRLVATALGTIYIRDKL